MMDWLRRAPGEEPAICVAGRHLPLAIAAIRARAC